MAQEKQRMSGKLCLVTGATSGIGAATALAPARAGGTVEEGSVRNEVRRGAFAAAWLALAIFGWGGPCLADDTYYPYPMYERYWEDVTGPAAPESGKAAPEGTKAPREAKPPPAWQRVPGFLFPKELGFGVAVGVPEDLFYLSGDYYRVREGAWQRSTSWRGPWKPVARAKLPPVLLERDLASIRRLRNREFREYWEKRESYPGRHFRPGESGGKKRPD